MRSVGESAVVLHPLHGGRVYAVGEAPLSKQGAYLAAVMACGSGSMLSHRSAADLWGMRPSSAGMDVTVARGRHRVDGLRVHHSRALQPQDVTVRDGIPVTSVARTLLDLSAVIRRGDLEVAVDRAERLGLFDLNAVVDVLERAFSSEPRAAKGRELSEARSRPTGSAPRSSSRSNNNPRGRRALADPAPRRPGRRLRIPPHSPRP